MQKLAGTGRRISTSKQIYHCIYCIKHASTTASTASQALREQGPLRTRFAPSPTGFLHLGSMRTALFNYLVAKATNGQFLLRIEDTDQKRTIPDAEDRLFRDLEWAGIEWDEGPKIGGPYGPYVQSQRTAIYRDHVERLLMSGNAYRCFCTPERLHTLAEHRSKLGLPADYDRTCAHILKEESDDRAAKGQAHVVRLKGPKAYPPYSDLVYGIVRQRKQPPVGISHQQFFDDPILLKTDGFPTYHLANVVDDHLMKITHVIRGSEWMSSTPKHLALYEAFGWSPPAFAHVGLLLDQRKQKLSKRTGSTEIVSWRENGIFPETLTNFVALLGWSHNQGQDLMSMDDLIKNASMKFTRGDTVVSFEKLWFLQKRHAGRLASLQFSPTQVKPAEDLKELAVKPMIQLLERRTESEPLNFYISIPRGLAREEYVFSILLVDALNYTNPAEFIERNIYFFVTPTADNLTAEIPQLKLHNVPPGVTHTPSSQVFHSMFDQLAKTTHTQWTTSEIRSKLKLITQMGAQSSIQEVETSLPNTEFSFEKSWSKLIHQYLRWAISLGKSGPEGAETMRILGREETLSRLRAANKILDVHRATGCKETGSIIV